MYSVRFIKAEGMFPLVNEILNRGNNVRITVTGMSMYPFLREGIDSVELTRICFKDVHMGDIVMILRDNGQYILHRVLRKEKDCFYIAGDAQQWVEGPVYPEQLVAAACTVWRRDRQIGCNDVLWKALTILWIWMLPFRYLTIKILSRLKKIIDI